jgi:hypothetical protein
MELKKTMWKLQIKIISINLWLEEPVETKERTWILGQPLESLFGATKCIHAPWPDILSLTCIPQKTLGIGWSWNMGEDVHSNAIGEGREF